MDFKAQVASDMKIFHNCGEFATTTKVWYGEEEYTIPLIIDHTAADERQKKSGDNAEGLYKTDCLVYISHADLRVIPKKGREIEIEVGGAIEVYQIEKVEYEDGEIVLELAVLEE